MIRREARLDLNRRKRLGMIEAIWGEHKTSEQIESILNTLQKEGELALVTRVDEKKANNLLNCFQKAIYHSKACCLTLGEPLELKDSNNWEVVIISGGTSDLQVAAEAELALRFHGVKTNLLLDLGVAGLHRLIDNLDKFNNAKVVIACAGMEGALPTVLAGLIPQPVIGIPVSVGYGISLDGRTALNGMLASCAPGLMVGNIDNGYGAAMAAFRIVNSIDY